MPEFSRIIADSDLDGLCAAAVLKAANPDAEVHFAHAALVRSGAIDSLIDRTTAMVDLPFHPQCGWYLDHHQTNRPNEEQEARFVADGGTCHWEATPSAARLAYDVLSPYLDVSHLEEIMPVVDALDSGRVSPLEVVMAVPATGKYLHKADTLLHQAASHETLFAKRSRSRIVQTVSLVDMLRFLSQVDNARHFRLHAESQFITLHAGK